MKKISQQPILCSIAFVLGIIGIHKIPVFTFFEMLGFTKMESELIDKTILNSLVILIAVLLIKQLKLGFYAGLNIVKWQKPQLYLIMILYLLIFTNGFRAFTTIKAHESVMTFMVGLFLLKSITAGVLEEIVFRGFIQSLIVRHFEHQNKNIFMGVVTAAAIFGVGHIINLGDTNYTLQGVLSQVFAATCLGSLFGAILLRTKNIYPIMLIHTSISFFSLIGTLFPSYFSSNSSQIQTTAQNIISLIFTTILFGSALIIAFFLTPPPSSSVRGVSKP